MKSFGMVMISFGIFLVALGLMWLLAERWPFWGRLPGDLRWEGRRLTVYAPIATCLLISLLITVMLNVVSRVFWR